VIIFAGTKGYLADYDLRALTEYEKQLFSHLESSHPDVFTEIEEKKVISSELEDKLKKILDDFKGIFNPPELSIV
jgi:F-type H+-transporting ATPase subunit alpha